MGNLFSSTSFWGRPQVPQLCSLDLEGVAERLQSAGSVVVLLGAGASTSCGIPDFRTPGTGLYDNLQKYNLPKPEAIFEIGFFQRNPAPFYELVAELWPGKHRPSPSHYFVKLLHDKGCLRRCYTQNIDSLETTAGLPAELLVAAHGNMDSCHVAGRRTPVPLEEFRQALVQGQSGLEQLRTKYNGLVKPDIVFFGESLPERFFSLQDSDLSACDLLVVVGTSLAVRPFSDLVGRARRGCPRLLVNRERVGLAPGCGGMGNVIENGFRFDDPRNKSDVFCAGDCDEVLARLCTLCGWGEDLQRLVDSQ